MFNLQWRHKHFLKHAPQCLFLFSRKLISLVPKKHLLMMIIAIFLWLCNTGNTLSFKDSFNCGNHFRNQSWSRIVFAESGLHQWVIWGLICGAKGASGKNKTKLWCFRCDSFLPELIVNSHSSLKDLSSSLCGVTRRGADSALTSPSSGPQRAGQGRPACCTGELCACVSPLPLPCASSRGGSWLLGSRTGACMLQEPWNDMSKKFTCLRYTHQATKILGNYFLDL